MQSQNQNASNLWNASSMNSNANLKLDSENTWRMNAAPNMWDTSTDNKAGVGLPNGISSSGSVSNVMSSSATTSAGGWGDSLPGGGTFPGSNPSGAQSESDSGQSNSFGSAMWQGIRNMSAVDMDNKEAASQDSGWGTQSSNNSVIGSGLSVSASSGSSAFNAKGVSAMNQESANMGQWGQNSSNTTNNVWGSSPAGSGGGFDNVSATNKPDSTGWGSPCPSPISNAGTEGWGQPTKQPPQAWGQGAPTGWGEQQPPPPMPPPPPQQQQQQQQLQQQHQQQLQQGRRPSSSAWEEPDRSSGTAGWGDAPKADASSSSWSRPAPSAWGPPTENKSAQQSQWGSSGASGPPSQWPGSSASQPSSANNQIGAWGSGNPMTAARPPQPSQAPRPIGSQVPPVVQAQPPAPGPPPTPQQPQPGSWAEAAGRGLPAKPSPVGTTPRQITREELITEAVNSADNWGKVPVRQDASWDKIEDSPKLPRKPLTSSSSTGSQEDLHWNQPNNGTAIWESAKQPQAPTSIPPQPTNPSNVWDQASSGASGATNEWGVSSDNDGGTWNGDGSQTQSQQQQQQPPPPQQYQQQQQHPQHYQPQQMPPPQQDSNMWNGPPTNNTYQQQQPPNRSNMWGGNDERPGSNSWSSGSSGSNDSKKNMYQAGPPPPPPPPPQQPGQPEPRKSDNVWDRNGTSLWGDPEKTETGTWKSEGMRRNSSTGSWDNGANQQWRPPPAPQPENNPSGTAYWGNPDKIPGQWNNPSNPSTPMTPHAPQPITGRPPNDKIMWGQTAPPSKPGWGDMSPPGSRDDAAMWNQANKPAGWGDGQWQKRNVAPPSWGEQPDWNGMNASRKPPQRSRMLQQLMDMGFKKEDAQNSLIRNDMDLDRAINDLVASAKRHEYDPDNFRGRQLKGMGSSEDLADAPLEFMPPQNTLTNAQGLHNTQVIASPYAKQGPSLPHMSSLSAPSINPLQQKMLPQQLGKPPIPTQPGQPIRGQLPNQTQQMIQAQIVQQLQMAVQAGLISPQLLNQHLTPAMLVMLQQLLQLQQLYQQLVAQQQVLQQNKTMPPLHQRTQLEQVSLTITKIKQKIAQVQQALAKQANTQQPPPAGLDPNKDLVKDLQADISNLHLKDNPVMHQQAQQQNQPGQQSRLTQWKLPSPERDLTGQLAMDLNRAPGSRPIGPHSTPPNLQNKMEPGAQFNDPWGSASLASTSTMWPSTSTTATTTAALPQSDTKTSTATTMLDDKESLGNNHNQAKSNHDDMNITGANSTDPATPTSSAALDIEEFVPGKPWQGIVTKTADDDPHLTPGQVAMRRPISINTVKDEYVMNTLGKSSSSSSLNSSPTVSEGTTTTSTWSTGGSVASSMASSSSSPNLLAKSSWSSTVPTESTSSMFVPNANDIWGMSTGGAPKSRRPPPGLMNRSVSCPGGPGGPANPGNWGSSWLILKNLPSQVDGATVKHLCSQQGALQTFLHSAQFGQAYVCYKSREDAIRAQKSLNALMIGNTAIAADFVGDGEVARLQELSGASQGGAPATSTGGAHWSQQPMHSGLRPPFGGQKFEQAQQLNGAANFGVGGSSGGSTWGTSGNVGGSGGLWGPIDEHPDNMLPGGLLGGH